VRKLPVYLLIDTSGSMKGEPIEAVNVGLHALVSSLRRDPQALETAHLSVITFDREAKLILPMTPVEDFQLPVIESCLSGPTMTGAALELLCQRVDLEVCTSSTGDLKRDWKPLLFLMTDGTPSDSQKYKEMVSECKNRHFGAIIACAAGMKANVDVLKGFADKILTLATCDSSTFNRFFAWVSASISVSAQGSAAASLAIIPESATDGNKMSEIDAGSEGEIPAQ